MNILPDDKKFDKKQTLFSVYNLVTYFFIYIFFLLFSDVEQKTCVGNHTGDCWLLMWIRKAVSSVWTSVVNHHHLLKIIGTSFF